MAKAEGRVDAPFLVVMASKPSERMEGWFWQIVQGECKILKTDVRIIYLIDGQPENSGNRPSVAQIKAAWPRFYREMKESKCKVCMPMGGPALLNSTGITQTILDARGYVLSRKHFKNLPIKEYKQIGEYKNNSKVTGRKKGEAKYGWVTTTCMGGCLGDDFTGFVIPSFGLDHIRTEGFAVKPAFKEDVARCARALKGELRLLDDILSKNHYITVPNWTPFEALRDIISVDIETHGVDNEVIDLVSFSDGTITACFKWDSDARNILNRIFALPNRYFAVHNSPFDIPRLVANGVTISQEVLDKRIIDTMFAAVVIQPDLHKSLARVITIYHDVEPWKGQRGSEWHDMSLLDPIFYSAKDAFVTAWLAISLIKVAKNLGSWKLLTGTDGHPGPGVFATIQELTDMHRKGIQTDKEKANIWCDELEKELLELENQWAEMFPGMNVHSTDQVAKLFYEEWGLPVQRKTEDAVTTDILACIRLQYFVGSDYAKSANPGPWMDDSRCKKDTFDLLLKIRDVAKTLGTYVQPVSLGSVTWIHPSYMPVSKDAEFGGGSATSKGNTSTGRLASFGPNIQNQPKKVRSLYIPDSKDMCYIEGDYRMAELYVMGAMAKDQRLMDDLNSGDMHQRNAERYGVPRDTAKNVTYAGQYLAGPPKVSETILKQEYLYVPVEVCKKIMEGQAEYYYKVAAYKRHIVKMCETKKYVINPFGRLRFFHSGSAPAAVDFIPQSIVADIVWCVLRPVAEMARSLGGRLTTTVHDSILIQVPKDKVEQAARLLKQIMEKKFDCVAPNFFIPIDLKVGNPGDSWGDLKKYALS